LAGLDPNPAGPERSGFSEDPFDGANEGFDVKRFGDVKASGDDGFSAAEFFLADGRG
jgi:hypothetical protein